MAEGSQDEAALVASAREGDEAARRALFQRCAPRVHAVALHFFGGDASAASDVVQEVFVKAFDRLGSFRGEAQLATWLHRVTVNACLDERRSRRRLVGLDAAQREGVAHDDAAERSQREALVRRAVTRLPPKLRIAVLLRHFEDLSYDEMASALGCSTGTVASRLSRGHAQLARELAALQGGAP